VKKTLSFLVCMGLALSACGLKVPATIVAGSDAELNGITDPADAAAIDPATGDVLDPTVIDPVLGETVVGPVAGDSIFNLEREGVTRDKITICAHVPITGAAPIQHHPNRFGQFYFDAVNAEQGGVYGREVVFRAIDDQYYPAGARAAMEQCAREGAFIYFGAAGTDQIVSVAKWAETKRVPYIHGPSSDKDMAGLHYNVFAGPSYEYQHKLLARYLVKRYGKDQVFGTVHVASPFFESGAKAFADELKKLGAQHAVTIQVQKDESQFSNVFFQLQNAEVDIVNNFTTPNIWIKMLNQKPPTYDPIWTAVSPVAGFNIVSAALAGANADAVVFHNFGPACECQTYTEAIPPPKSLPWYDDIQEFLRVFKKYSPEKDPAPDDFDYSSYLAAKGVHRLLLELGKDPTRTKLFELFDSYKEKPADVYPGCAADFTRGSSRVGAWRVNVFDLANGVWKQTESCIDSV